MLEIKIEKASCAGVLRVSYVTLQGNLHLKSRAKHPPPVEARWPQRRGSRQCPPIVLLFLPRSQSGAKQSFWRGEEASSVVETRLSQEWRDCSMFKDMSQE